MVQLDKSIDTAATKVNGAAKAANQSFQRGSQQAEQYGKQAVDQYGSQAMTAINDIKSFVSDEAPDYLKHAYADLREATDKYVVASKATINKYPIYSVVGAVAAGTLLGLFLGRSKK